MKRILSKDEWEKLSDAIKELYKESGGKYVLQLDDDGDDAGALKRAKDREVQLRKDAEKKLKELQDKIDEIDGNDARKRGDIETLERSWKEKHERLEQERDVKVKGLTDQIVNHLIDGQASALAAKISKAPKLLLPHIKSRLNVEFDGEGVAALKVLDAAGKPSAATLDELEKEIVDTKEFADIIIASRASGSAGAPKGNGVAPPQGADGAPIPLSKMAPEQAVVHIASVIESRKQN